MITPLFEHMFVSYFYIITVKWKIQGANHAKYSSLIYVGAEVGGIFGSICATFGVVFPAFVIILIVAKFYKKFKASKIVKGCMSGLKPAVVGLIGTAVISIGRTVFFPKGISASIFADISSYVAAVIFALSLFPALKKKSPILIISLSAILGIAAGYLIL